MNTHESYVSLETAKLLKQAGFDWECVKNYMGEIRLLWTATTPGNLNDDSKVHKGWKSAPTLAVAQRWLREIHHTLVDVVMLVDKIVYGYRLQVFTDKSMQEIDYQLGYDTYESALEAGIKKCLTLLLQK